MSEDNFSGYHCPVYSEDTIYLASNEDLLQDLVDSVKELESRKDGSSWDDKEEARALRFDIKLIRAEIMRRMERP